MKPFLHKVYRLMAEEQLSYQEACRIIGQHGARKRRLRQERAESLWVKIERAASKKVVVTKPESSFHQVQMKFDFSES